MIIELVIILLSQNVLNVLSENSTESLPERVQNDPDFKLCNDLTVDAAVQSDDGFDLIFKDEFYWVIDRTGEKLEKDFAKPISNRWPELTIPIDAAFTLVDELGKYSTVFITVRHSSGYLSIIFNRVSNSGQEVVAV